MLCLSRKYKNSNNIYVVGNNAVKLEGNYSAFKETRAQRENSMRTKTTQRRNYKQSNARYTLVLIFVIMATLAVVMLLLKTQFIVSDNSARIISLQQQLVDINKSNAQIETEIKKSIDMNEVYTIATEELGMIQPTQQDIRYIENDDTTYTVQYADGKVIEEDEGISIGNVLGFISKGW